MNLIHLLTNYTPVTKILLTLLTTEDKRRLFFTNTDLQNTLAEYPQMQQFTDILPQAYITFSFPKITHGKHNIKHSKRRAFVNLPINALAIKIPCTKCNVQFYNAQYETEFQTCTDHKSYNWTDDKMLIKHTGKDLLGKYWITTQTYKPVGSARALCYCKICKKFLYYNPVEIGYTELTCLKCHRAQHTNDRNNDSITIYVCN
jgi:hypothetical protein